MEGISLNSRVFATLRAMTPTAALEVEQLPAFRTLVADLEQEALRNGLAFDSVPFMLPAAQDLTASELADRITMVFYSLRTLNGPVMSLVWKQVTGFAQDKPQLANLLQAGERIAADWDRGLGLKPDNAYHTLQHTLETVLLAHFLSLIAARQRGPLSDEEHLLLLLAALCHDWYHDGSAGELQPFEMENISIQAMRTYVQDITLGQLNRLELMIRASDNNGPQLFFRELVRWHHHGRTTPVPDMPDAYMALAPLAQADQARTTELAAMLRDCDTIALCALTVDYAFMKSRQLGEEWMQPLTQQDYTDLLLTRLGHFDERPCMIDGQGLSFDSAPGRVFDLLLEQVISGHDQMLRDYAEHQPASPAADSEGIDLSVFEMVQQEAEALPTGPIITLESVASLKATLRSAGFFDAPPFVIEVRDSSSLIAQAQQALLQRIGLTEEAADSLIRLHTVSGPLFSAVISHLFEQIGLRIDDPVYRAASQIARDLDLGIGTGTKDDERGGERNPFTNQHHILDLLLLSDMMGQRATQRQAAASSPLARGLALLAAMICRWHHTGAGNTVEGQYRLFHLQDRALSFAAPYLEGMSRELRQSLEILVRGTDPRQPYAFTRAAFSYHVGLGPRPDIPAGCDSMARLLGDPALCTLAARLNDALFVPFVGLGRAFSARALVQLGQEIGQPIDFNFVRRNLIAPMLSRPIYPGERPHPAVLLGNNKVASFTTAEAQTLFNPAMQALMIQESDLKTPTPRDN